MTERRIPGLLTRITSPAATPREPARPAIVFVPGRRGIILRREGAMLLLDTLGSARARGARILRTLAPEEA